MENENSFEYTYSAPEQDEIRKIREKYLMKEEAVSKLEQLRNLDKSVTNKGTFVSILLGVVSTLVMGAGMSLCLVWTEYMATGIIVGILGMLGIAAAYPVYVKIVRREKKRITPLILKLSEELLQ